MTTLKTVEVIFLGLSIFLNAFVAFAMWHVIKGLKR